MWTHIFLTRNSESVLAPSQIGTTCDILDWRRYVKNNEDFDLTVIFFSLTC